jgi:hypothetical protein
VLIVLCWLESGSNSALRNVSHALTDVLGSLAYAVCGQAFRFCLPSGLVVDFFNCSPRRIETPRGGGLGPPLYG